MKLISVKDYAIASISQKISTLMAVFLMFFVGALNVRTLNVSNTASSMGWPPYANGILSGNQEVSYLEKLTFANFYQTNTHILFIINILTT